MKEKIEQAIREALEREGYMVRLVEVSTEEDAGIGILERDFINSFVGRLIIRAQRKDKTPR